jgi:peptidoglycan/xylan/chitin deacetylase (PgdA/CDA1 family)
MLNYLKQRCGPTICSMIPLDIWHRLLDIELVIPHWHLASDQELEHVSGLYTFRNEQQFKADLEFFLRYYTPVALQDVVSYLEGTHRLPKRCFLPTFDDGFRQIYEVVAPILHAQGVPAVFFLITSFIDNHELGYPQKKSLLIRVLNSLGDSQVKEIEHILIKAGIQGQNVTSRVRNIYYRQRHLINELGAILGCDFLSYVSSAQPYMTSEQVRDIIKMGFDIGAHSIDHPLYSELTLDEQLVQTRDSMEWLSTRFQYNCQSFAFPYGLSGVSAEFFEKAFSDGRLKVSFGSGGILGCYYSRYLPRFSMERSELPAALILAPQFGKAILRKLFKSIATSKE